MRAFPKQQLILPISSLSPKTVRADWASFVNGRMLGIKRCHLNSQLSRVSTFLPLRQTFENSHIRAFVFSFSPDPRRGRGDRRQGRAALPHRAGRRRLPRPLVPPRGREAALQVVKMGFDRGLHRIIAQSCARYIPEQFRRSRARLLVGREALVGQGAVRQPRVLQGQLRPDLPPHQRRQERGENNKRAMAL